MANNIKLGYWGIRGRGQILRLALAYTEAQWENVAYTDPAQWFGKDKNSLGLDFPNLPYLIDGDLKISESSAILRYIAARSEKKQLLGKNLQDSAKVNQVVSLLDDVRTTIGRLFFDKDWESKLKQAWEKVKPKLDYFEKFVGNKEWVLGYVTIADIEISELSYYFEKLFPEEYKQYPSWQRIRDGFNNLPQIKAYYASETAIKGPFVPPAYSAIQF